jgi:hypothetical protein
MAEKRSAWPPNGIIDLAGRESDDWHGCMRQVEWLAMISF